MTVLIEARGAYKRYRGGVQTDPLTFSLHPGEIAAVVGPNGSGKSTLLRMVAGIARPSGGQLVRNGTLAYLPHPFEPPAQFLVMDYLVRMARLRGVTSVAARQFAERLVGELDLDGFRTERMGALSSGNLRRVGIAQALVASPDVVILDEPENGLDARGRLLVQHLLRAHRESGRAVLVAQHPAAGVPATSLTFRIDDDAVNTALEQPIVSYEIVLGESLHAGDIEPLEGMATFEGQGRVIAHGEEAQRVILRAALTRGIQVHSVTPITGTH